jgi:hypothetical protein
VNVIRKVIAASFAFSFAVSLPLPAATSKAPAPTNLSAAEIVNRNVTARGGLQAWRAVQSISFHGRMGAGGNQRATLQNPVPGKQAPPLPTDVRPATEVQLPFEMVMARPLKVRFELSFRGQTAVQVYDGEKGWKLRPYLNRLEVEPYTVDELKKSSMQAALDGPLVDYVAKGTKVELESTEPVEDGTSYKLRLTLKNGDVMHVWVDTKTFLETKVEGQPRRLDGVEHPVEIYYRDYRSVSGLQIPFELETQVLPVTSAGSKVKPAPIPAERIVLDRVSINPKLDAAFFAKPDIQAAAKPL